jgi:hypothetical protein
MPKSVKMKLIFLCTIFFVCLGACSGCDVQVESHESCSTLVARHSQDISSAIKANLEQRKYACLPEYLAQLDGVKLSPSFELFILKSASELSVEYMTREDPKVGDVAVLLLRRYSDLALVERKRLGELRYILKPFRDFLRRQVEAGSRESRYLASALLGELLDDADIDRFVQNALRGDALLIAGSLSALSANCSVRAKQAIENLAKSPVVINYLVKMLTANERTVLDTVRERCPSAQLDGTKAKGSSLSLSH